MSDYKIILNGSTSLQFGDSKSVAFEKQAKEMPTIVKFDSPEQEATFKPVENNTIIDDNIFGILDSNKDGKIDADDEAIKTILDIIQGENIDDTKKAKETDNTKETDKASQKDVSDLTPEEIEDMDAEELIELYRSEVEQEIFKTKNASHMTSNPIFLELVNKMSDEKLDEFMNLYKEKYPTTKMQDGSLTFTSYETLLSNLMWGAYSVDSGLMDAETAYSALERLKKYCPGLIAEGSDGIRQWA